MPHIKTPRHQNTPIHQDNDNGQSSPPKAASRSAQKAPLTYVVQLVRFNDTVLKKLVARDVLRAPRRLGGTHKTSGSKSTNLGRNTGSSLPFPGSGHASTPSILKGLAPEVRREGRRVLGRTGDDLETIKNKRSVPKTLKTKSGCSHIHQDNR